MIFVDHSDAGDLLSQLFQHCLQKQHIVPVLRQKRLIKVVGQIAICHNELFGTLKIVFRHTSQQLTELRQYTAFVKPEGLILIRHIFSLPFPCSNGACAKVVGLLRTQIPLDTMLLRARLRSKRVQSAGVRAHGIDRTPIIPQHTAYTAAIDCSQHEYMEAGG